MSKLMDIMTRHAVRGRILRLCKECAEDGASMEVITAALRREGYDVNKKNVIEECAYLAGKGFIKIAGVKNEFLGISRDIAYIEPGGTDLLEGTVQSDGIILGD